MIIVSQDKKEMINFDNITRIFIEDFSEDGDGFGIGADTNSAESQCWDLGYYATEERAKEVLMQLQISYANMKMVMIPCIRANQEIPSKELMRNICYQMPKE